MNNVTVEMAEVTCYTCSVVFAIPLEMKNKLKTCGGTFYCPNGHGQHYSKTENQILKEELEKSKAELQEMSNKLSIINNSACSHLEHHMKTKHAKKKKVKRGSVR